MNDPLKKRPVRLLDEHSVMSDNDPNRIYGTANAYEGTGSSPHCSTNYTPVTGNQAGSFTMQWILLRRWRQSTRHRLFS
jgi:hypothetical protein